MRAGVERLAGSFKRAGKKKQQRRVRDSSVQSAGGTRTGRGFIAVMLFPSGVVEPGAAVALSVRWSAHLADLRDGFAFVCATSSAAC